MERVQKVSSSEECPQKTLAEDGLSSWHARYVRIVDLSNRVVSGLIVLTSFIFGSFVTKNFTTLL